MALFVVTLRLPETFDEEFVAVIPRHRAFVSSLIEENVVLSYAISADRSRGWVTMQGPDAETVRNVVEQFPLYRFMQQVEIDELFVFDSVATRLPKISLN
ncbi:hypothetical protein F0P96_15915 [Hymenobacter busanensis]|uniref:Uncharacterized protein n=1 Tax=Hymenobacter busanensis TaxID=2607656 RepID=A0A7L4ZTD2_9BACT|nr:hypothetical protein [Hymenobacter busanensis]KAA9327469.1 hypothetical protein F0P96_15915 [Hymenobacter busanensis]QHJ06193.1 hypothetical protein GUY19_02320 [Hymenobacter busanensis]